jgi:DNA-binding response OmpR family regulator
MIGGSKTKKEKVLIVDNDSAAVKALALMLEPEGLQILKAYGGADGLRMTTEEHPDLVLLDIAMPDVNGYEVLTKIKDRGIPTRVIMITGYSTSIRDVVKYIKAGACDYLLKPVAPTDMLDAVKRALAVETTINLHISDTTPIVEQLIATAEKLAQDKSKLEQQNKALINQKHKIFLIMVAIRLLCLSVAIALTALLHSFGLVTGTWAFLLPIILFFLLLLPIERVKKLSIKAPKTETSIEM